MLIRILHADYLRLQTPKSINSSRNVEALNCSLAQTGLGEYLGQAVLVKKPRVSVCHSVT